MFFYVKLDKKIPDSGGGIRTHDQLVTLVFLFPKRVDYIISREGSEALPQLHFDKWSWVLSCEIVSEPSKDWIPACAGMTIFGLAADYHFLADLGFQSRIYLYYTMYAGSRFSGTIHLVFQPQLLEEAAFIVHSQLRYHCATPEFGILKF